MKNNLTRKEFLKLLTASGATTLGLSGCGNMTRYVTRTPYQEMPEYQLPGESVYYATTCGECSAGCGLVVRTVEGRGIKIEGNPNHPVNRGRTCSRGQTALQGLYDPDRIRNPIKQVKRGSGEFQDLGWEEAVSLLSETLQDTKPDELGILLGIKPDHVYDLFFEVTQALGAPPPLRFGALGLFEARKTLQQAADRIFGRDQIPYFNLEQAEVVLSFGANFTETWLSPVAYSQAYGEMRQGERGKRGSLIQFESRMSQTAAIADLWIPIRPGSDGIVAAGIGKIAADIQGLEGPEVYQDLSIDQVVTTSGIPRAQLEKIARIYAEAEQKVAVPGGGALGHVNGDQNAAQILALNLFRSEGKGNEVAFIDPPDIKVGSQGGMNSFTDLNDLVRRMEEGKINTLLIHGVDPLFELPHVLGFQRGLDRVERVISFSPLGDETAGQADYIFPDHTPLESWGYQRIITASDRTVLSGFQPVVTPLYNTQAVVDVVLSAVQKIGGDLSASLNYHDEVDFLQQKVKLLMAGKGFFQSEVIEGFWSKFLQFGGWWSAQRAEETPGVSGKKLTDLNLPELVLSENERGLDDYYFYPYPLAKLGDGAGANRPWLQETPDSMTTVMWNSWVEINPNTAKKLGVRNDDLIEIQTREDTFTVPVYLYPGIRPDTVAVPFGGGHERLGRFADGRGVNPLRVVAGVTNQSGDLAFGATLVRIKKTAGKKLLSRYESVEGVYGVEEK